MDSAAAKSTAGESKQRSGVKASPRRVMRSAAPVAVPAGMRSAVPPGGAPLPHDLRTQMETRFGQDFSDVVIHDGPGAERLAVQRDANAYALGNHLVFGAHRFSPTTPQGQRLIAHELAHVVQQRRGGPPAGKSSSTLEAHADRAADAAVPGTTKVRVAGNAAVGVMCAKKPKRRKHREVLGDEEEAEFEESQERATDRRRDLQREKQRADRELDRRHLNAIDIENARREIGRLEEEYSTAAAHGRGDKRKSKDWARYMELIEALPRSRYEIAQRNKRQGDFDEAVRTPVGPGVKVQPKFVFGNLALPFMDELWPGRARYAQPDSSEPQTRRDGSLADEHTNLKSDRVYRLSRRAARERARGYADQAMSNVEETGGGDFTISFGWVPPLEIQQEMLKQLFRDGSPIQKVKFGFSTGAGNTVYLSSEYTGDRERQRSNPKQRERWRAPVFDATVFGSGISGGIGGGVSTALPDNPGRSSDSIQGAVDRRGARRAARARDAANNTPPNNAASGAVPAAAPAAPTPTAQQLEKTRERNRINQQNRRNRLREQAANGTPAPLPDEQRVSLGIAENGRVGQENPILRQEARTRDDRAALNERRKGGATAPTPGRKGAAPLMSGSAPPATDPRSGAQKAGAATATSFAPSAPTPDSAAESPASTPKKKRGRMAAAAVAPELPVTLATTSTTPMPLMPRQRSDLLTGTRVKKGGADVHETEEDAAPPTTRTFEEVIRRRRELWSDEARKKRGADENKNEEAAEPAPQEPGPPKAAAPSTAQAKEKDKGKGKGKGKGKDEGKEKSNLARLASISKKREPNSIGKMADEQPATSSSKKPVPESKPVKAEKPEKPEKATKSEKPARAEKPEKPEKPGKPGKPGKDAKPESLAKPGKAPLAQQAKPVQPSQSQKAPPAQHQQPIPSSGADRTPSVGAPPVATPAKPKLPGSVLASAASVASSPEAAEPDQPDAPKRTPLPDADHGIPPPKRGVTTTSRAFHSGMVNIDVDEDYADSSKPYLVRTRITLSGHASTGATAGSRSSGSAQVGATGSYTIAYTTRMSLADKDAYLESVAAGHGGSHPAMPLVELIAREKFGEATALMQAQLAADDPREAFARRAEGDVMEISSEWQVSGGLGAGGNSASGGIGARGAISTGAGIRRYSAVTRGKEVITVVLQESSGMEGGGFGNLGLAKMDLTSQSDSRREQHVSFTLDPSSPDYAAQRAEIVGATSLEELNAIAARQPSLVSGRGSESLQSNMHPVEATLGSFGISIDQGGYFSEGESVDAEGRKTRDVAGGSTLGGAFVAFDQRINPVSQTDSFRGTTFADGSGEAVTEVESHSINYQRSFDTLASSAKEAPFATWLGLASGSQSLLLEDVDVSGVMLSDESHARIAEVALNRSLWHDSWTMNGVSRGSIEEWEATRQKVLAANSDRHLIQRALSEWEAGDSGRSKDVEMLAGDTGAAFDLPESLRDQRRAFELLVFRNPMGHAFEFLEQDQYDEALQELEFVDTRIDELSSAIQTGVADVGDAAKFAQMQRLIAERRGQVQNLTLQVQSAMRREAAENFTGPRQESAQTDEQMLAQEDSTARRALQNEQIKQFENEMDSNHKKESELFGAIEDSLDSWFRANYTVHITEQFTALQRMYEPWESQTRELARLYEALGESPDRASPHGPSWDRYRQLWAQFVQGH